MKKIITNAPKMYYTPEEIESERDYIQLAFMNTDIIFPQLSRQDSDDFSIKQTIINYKKIYFKNAKYEYIFVMEELIDKFHKIYI